MGDKWIPDDVLDLSPWYKNFTENPTAVQLDHRILVNIKYVYFFLKLKILIYLNKITF